MQTPLQVYPKIFSQEEDRFIASGHRLVQSCGRKIKKPKQLLCSSLCYSPVLYYNGGNKSPANGAWKIRSLECLVHNSMTHETTNNLYSINNTHTEEQSTRQKLRVRLRFLSEETLSLTKESM